MKQLNKLKAIIFGEPPIYEANDGKPIEEVVIRYKDFYFMIDLDVESGKPTGEFGWSEGTPMSPTPVRDIYIARRQYASKTKR